MSYLLNRAKFMTENYENCLILLLYLVCISLLNPTIALQI